MEAAELSNGSFHPFFFQIEASLKAVEEVVQQRHADLLASLYQQAQMPEINTPKSCSERHARDEPSEADTVFDSETDVYLHLQVPRRHSVASKLQSCNRVLKMHPIWDPAMPRRSGRYSMIDAQVRCDLFWESKAADTSGGLFQRLVRHPDSKSQMIWVMMSTGAIGYDLIMLPLQIFMGTGQQGVTFVMLWVTAVFWILDIPWQMFTGFHTLDGMLEMRLPKVVMNYATSRLVPDILLMLVDLGSLVLGMYTPTDQADPSGVLRLGKFTRFTRFLRMFRLFRGVKVLNLLRAAINKIRSEVLVTIFKVAGSIVMFLIINHYLACCWYFVATENAADVTWLDVAAAHRLPLGSVYVICLHWSLAQFTPAPNSLQPTNDEERIYTICVVIVAVLTFSSLLSTITAATMQLRNSKAARLQEENKIRDFLNRKNVSMQLSQQLWCFYRNQHVKNVRPVLEPDIAVLSEIPETMYMQLRWELYVPVLDIHPLLRQQCVVDPTAVTLLCRYAMTTDFITHGQDIFLEGSAAGKTFFPDSGHLEYRTKDRTIDLNCFRAPTIVAEIALWLRWKYIGRLTAITACEAVNLDVGHFHVIAEERASSMHLLMGYARAFVIAVEEEMSDGGIVTDLPLSRPLLAAGALSMPTSLIQRTMTGPLSASTRLQAWWPWKRLVDLCFGKAGDAREVQTQDAPANGCERTESSVPPSEGLDGC